MWLCHFVNCHFSIILTVSVCTKQNLIFFLNFLVLFFFNLVIYLTSVHAHPFFYFSQHLSLRISSRHSVAAVWGFPKCFSVQNNMEVVKSDGETMRSLCGILVCMWWSLEWALERVHCRRKKGKRIVEERRGRICEGSYPCRR